MNFGPETDRLGKTALILLSTALQKSQIGLILGKAGY